jgi:hypothetical protein
MLAVGGAVASFASSPAAGVRVSVGANDGRRSFRLVPYQVREGRHSPTLAVIAGRSQDPGSALSFFGSSGEAATPCFRKRLDPRMGSKGAQKVTDMVADRFTT